MDSHIIPRALTRLSRTGEKHIETGIGLPVIKRSDSWYDGQLVTREGEDILSDIDSQGISELRHHKLVWSSWGGNTRLREDEVELNADGMGFRWLELTQPKVLQVFFQSLLWRAAATRRHEFSKISLEDEELDELRQRVLSQDPGRQEDYPVQFYQLVSKGPEHNRTPLLEKKLVPRLDGSIEIEIPYVRFYFDGLVTHIHLARQYDLNRDYLKTCLGFAQKTMVFAHEASESRSVADIKEIMSHAIRQQLQPNRSKSSIAKAIAELNGKTDPG